MDLHQEIDNFDDFALMTEDQADNNVVLPIELTNTTGICLQKLNTHCLMEIFSSNSLTLTDLCSIAETCKRFKEIAERIFPKDLKVSSHCFTDNQCKLESKKYGKYCCSMRYVEQILKNFGPFVSAVSMKGNKLLKLLAMYCGTNILQHLSFYRCDLMTLVPCPYINYDSLTELEITSSTDFVVILRKTFPKLDRFLFYSFCYCDDSEILPNFFRRHKRIRTLNLSLDSGYWSSQLIETIADCTELTNLILGQWKIPMTSFNFANLKNLSKLTMLAVNCQIDHRQLIALLEVSQSLTTLKLRHLSDELTEIFSVLPQLPNLRNLHLEYGDFGQFPWSRLTQLKALYIRESFGKFSASHLLQIIRELKNLEELDHYDIAFYITGFKLSSENFSEIVKVVERRPNKLTFRCHLSKDFAKNYVPNKNVNLIEYTDSD